MMKYERFTWKAEKLQHLDDEVIMVVDNANKEWKGHILNIVDMLNELNDERMMYKTTIDKRIVELEEENEQLKQKVDFYKYFQKDARELEKENELLRQMIKENVFGRYEEGSLMDLEFKAIAYDDIVRLEISDESELKVIVICKQGKKESVKSFCRMFIPFGVCYEIKEE